MAVLFASSAYRVKGPSAVVDRLSELLAAIYLALLFIKYFWV